MKLNLLNNELFINLLYTITLIALIVNVFVNIKFWKKRNDVDKLNTELLEKGSSGLKEIEKMVKLSLEKDITIKDLKIESVIDS